MASTVPQAVIDQISATDNVIDSAVTLINGIRTMIADAVTQALANGATAAELAPVIDALTAIKGKTDALAAAIVANTPSQ